MRLVDRAEHGRREEAGASGQESGEGRTGTGRRGAERAVCSGRRERGLDPLDGDPADVPVSSGVEWFIGKPGAGKTTLAAARAAALVSSTGFPVFCIDSAGVAQLDHIPRARSLAAALDSVFRLRQHSSFTPRDGEEVETIARQALDRGRVILFVDEAAFWLSSRKNSAPSLLRLMRAHRHSQVHVLLTTQHFSADVPQEAISCAPVLNVFACESPAVLDRLERDYGLDRAAVKALQRGRYFRVETGFPS